MSVVSVSLIDGLDVVDGVSGVRVVFGKAVHAKRMFLQMQLTDDLPFT